EERLAALAADLDHDGRVALDLRLAAEARRRLDVERLVHDVFLAIRRLGQDLQPLLHVDVAGRAGADAAAGGADLRVRLVRRLENAGPDRHLDLDPFRFEPDLRHGYRPPNFASTASTLRPRNPFSSARFIRRVANGFDAWSSASIASRIA